MTLGAIMIASILFSTIVIVYLGLYYNTRKRAAWIQIAAILVATTYSCCMFVVIFDILNHQVVTI